MTIIINPGTEANHSATIENATEVARRLTADLSLDPPARDPSADSDGWFRFIFRKGDAFCEVDIPGDDPDVVCRGIPFEARRLYVDGSSWLYGFAIGIVEDHLERPAA